MRSLEKSRQLVGIQGIAQIRERKALGALNLVRTELATIRQRLEDTEDEIARLESERESLFERNRGLTRRGGLFTLRRRASAIESRRVDLTLKKMQLKSDVEIAVQTLARAHGVVAEARRRVEKLGHLSHLWRRESKIDAQRREDSVAEEG